MKSDFGPAPQFLAEILAHSSEAEAFHGPAGEITTYGNLRGYMGIVSRLVSESGGGSGEPVPILFRRGPGFIGAVLGVIHAGMIAVPLPDDLPDLELKKAIDLVGARIVLSDREGAVSSLHLRNAAPRTILAPRELEVNPEESPEFGRNCAREGGLLIFTSGTTSEPKCTLLTHQLLDFQTSELRRAWDISPSDRVLNALPFDHLHGLLFSAICPLTAGATVEIAHAFSIEFLWQRILARAVSIFMGTPTIYARMLQYWNCQPPDAQIRLSQAAAAVRLMISGSDVLPNSIYSQWKAVAGSPPLNRYGTSELGVICSQKCGEVSRPGSVGPPLPGVQIRIRSSDGGLNPSGAAGEVEVLSAWPFLGYWKNHDESASKVTLDGWLRTGDIGILNADGTLEILGRASIDVFKSHGYLISALEIENELKNYPGLEDACVVGQPRPDIGNQICAVYSEIPGISISQYDLIKYLESRLSRHKIPTKWKSIREVPRNRMGKVNRRAVQGLFTN